VGEALLSLVIDMKVRAQGGTQNDCERLTPAEIWTPAVETPGTTHPGVSMRRRKKAARGTKKGRGWVQARKIIKLRGQWIAPPGPCKAQGQTGRKQKPKVSSW
jgi:hypothetical protein